MSHNLKKIIHSRRSIREFDPEFKLENDDLNRLLDLARYVPTAFNLQHERFLVVKDPEQRQKIREAAWDQKQVTDASALVIMCADLQCWQKPEAVFENAPKEIRELFIKQLIPNYYQGQAECQRDEGFRSASMAAYGLMLAAEAAELSTCPIGGFDFEAVGKLINLPETYAVIMMVAIGKAAAPAMPHLTQLPLHELVKINRF